MNGTFTEWQFEMALRAANFDSTKNSYPKPWRDTLVIFMHKEGGGFRSLSRTFCLAKLFERLIQGKLDFLAESEQWLPDYQFESSSTNDMEILLADV